MKAHPCTAITLCLAIAAVSGCAGTPPPVAVDGRAGMEGRIASIDLQPWTYDGNAVVELDTVAHGTVVVELPARWNLCKAPPVDTDILTVGTRVRAVGALAGERRLVVCGDKAHLLMPVGQADSAPRGAGGHQG